MVAWHRAALISHRGGVPIVPPRPRHRPQHPGALLVLAVPMVLFLWGMAIAAFVTGPNASTRASAVVFAAMGAGLVASVGGALADANFALREDAMVYRMGSVVRPYREVVAVRCERGRVLVSFAGERKERAVVGELVNAAEVAAFIERRAREEAENDEAGRRPERYEAKAATPYRG